MEDGEPGKANASRDMGRVLYRSGRGEDHHRICAGSLTSTSRRRPQLLVPNKHGILPHCVDVPVLIKIKSTTARMSRTKADKHLEGKPIFPYVDFDSTDHVFIKMRQKFTVRAVGDFKNSTNEIVLAYLKGKDLPSSSYYKHWQADTTPSDKEEMGRWVQQWTLQPAVKLHRFPPTFSCDLVDCGVSLCTVSCCTVEYRLILAQYTISVDVPFPGMGNSIHVSMPVTLDSGIDQATPMKSGRAAHQPQRRATTSSDGGPSGGSTDVPVPQDEQPPSLPP